MKKLFYILFVGCLLLSSCGNGASKNGNNSNSDDAILMEMLNVHQKRQALMSRIEATYNGYKRSLASGSATAHMAEAGLWKYKQEMERLCDEYIELAKKLNDNETVLEEAKRQKRDIMSAFKDMGF